MLSPKFKQVIYKSRVLLVSPSKPYILNPLRAYAKFRTGT